MATPRPFHYCRVCYRNFTDYEWKKHRFNPKHKQRLEDKLAAVEVSLEHLLSPTDEVTLLDLDYDAASFECYFCADYSPLKNAAEEEHNTAAPDMYVSTLLFLILLFRANSHRTPARGCGSTWPARNTARPCSSTLSSTRHHRSISRTDIGSRSRCSPTNWLSTRVSNEHVITTEITC